LRVPLGDDPRVIRHFDPPIRRTRLGSWLDARKAVKCGVHLEDYLFYRLRSYLRKLPQNAHPLPAIVSVDGGKISVEHNPHANDHPLARLIDDPAGVSIDAQDPQEALVRWLRATHAAEGQMIARELGESEEEYGRLNASFLEANEGLTEISRGQQEEIREGQSFAPKTLARRKEERGRPPLGTPWMLLGCAAATAMGLACEAYQFALPYYDMMGIDSTNLAAEWERNPTGVLAGAGFAVGASGALFALYHWLFELAHSLYRDAEISWRTITKGGWALALAGLLGATAYCIGDLRHGTGASSSSFLSALRDQVAQGDSSTTVFVLLTALIPMAVAWSWHKAKPEIERRRQIRACQREWELEENKRLEVGERREEIVRQIRQERDLLDRMRATAREKIRELARRAQDAEQRLRDKIETERRFSIAFASALVSALEQDRFYFVREAWRRGLAKLIAQSSDATLHESRCRDVVPYATDGGGNGRAHGSVWDPTRPA
jgi:hypothetical protein